MESHRSSPSAFSPTPGSRRFCYPGHDDNDYTSQFSSFSSAGLAMGASFASTNRALPETACRTGPLLAVHPPIPPPTSTTVTRQQAASSILRCSTSQETSMICSGWIKTDLNDRLQKCELEMRKLILLTDKYRRTLHPFESKFAPIYPEVIGEKTYGSDSHFQRVSHPEHFLERLRSQMETLSALMAKGHLANMRCTLLRLNTSIQNFEKAWSELKALEDKSKIVGKRPPPHFEIQAKQKSLVEAVDQLLRAIVDINALLLTTVP